MQEDKLLVIWVILVMCENQSLPSYTDENIYSEVLYDFSLTAVAFQEIEKFFWSRVLDQSTTWYIYRRIH